MIKIFKPFLAGIERRIQEAASNQAACIVRALKSATYDRTAGHWNQSYAADIERVGAWKQTTEAFTNALLADVQKDIEKYAIDLLKERAKQWEAEIFPPEE